MVRVDRTLRFSIILLIVGLAASPGMCWGPDGHGMITRHAIEILPAELKPFYEANKHYLTALCMLPDDWRQTHRETGPEHYFDMDKLDAPPFDKIRGSREEVEQRFGKEKVLEMGVLPWVIEQRFNKLVDAFKKGDEVQVVVQSALLAHYIGDAHVPFHATKDWDGRKPEHKGLHFRWETALLALHLKPESIKPAAPQKVNAILDSAFDWCAESLTHVEAICAAEDKAREQDPNDAYRYYDVLAHETLQIAEKRMTQAAEALAGTYIAAWEQAGKPKLSEKPALLFWGY